MPSYGGDPIFGRSVTMTTALNPPAVQQTGRNGADGIESMYFGTRGRVTQVNGVLAAIDVPTLAAMLDLFQSYYDGRSRVLVDSYGVAWPQVLLESFVPQGRVLCDYRGYYQPYQARFRHLI